MVGVENALAERATSGTAGWRAALLSAILGAASFGAPHFGFLLIADVQTFFHRETTLWMTYLLLLISAAYAGSIHAKRWRQVAAMMAGTFMAVILYLLTTVDLHGSQIYGAISPLFLWSVAMGTSLMLIAPIVIGGLLLGEGLKAIRSTRVASR